MPEIPGALEPFATGTDQLQAVIDTMGAWMNEVIVAYRQWAAETAHAFAQAMQLAEALAEADRRWRAETSAMHREYHRRRKARQRRNR